MTIQLQTIKTISLVAINFILRFHEQWRILSLKLQLLSITSSNNSSLTIHLPTVIHDHLVTNSEDTRKQIDSTDLQSKKSNLLINYEQQKTHNNSTTQRRNKNYSHNSNMETPTIITKFIPSTDRYPTKLLSRDIHSYYHTKLLSRFPKGT